MSSLSSSPSFELRSALAGAPAPVLETALSLLEASAPLMEGSGGAAAGGASAEEDRRVWLAAVARLAIRFVAVLEGAAAEDEQQRHTAAEAFEGKASPAQGLPLTLSALLAALDVRCVVYDRNRRETSARIGPRAGGKVEGGKERTISKKEREAKEKKSHLSRPRPPAPPLRPAISPPDSPPKRRETTRRAKKKRFLAAALDPPPFFSTLRPQKTHPLRLLPPPAFTLSPSKHLDRPSIKTGSRASSRSSQSSPSASSPSRAPPSRGGGARSRAPAA